MVFCVGRAERRRSPVCGGDSWFNTISTDFDVVVLGVADAGVPFGGGSVDLKEAPSGVGDAPRFNTISMGLGVGETDRALLHGGNECFKEAAV